MVAESSQDGTDGGHVDLRDAKSVMQECDEGFRLRGVGVIPGVPSLQLVNAGP